MKVVVECKAKVVSESDLEVNALNSNLYDDSLLRQLRLRTQWYGIGYPSAPRSGTRKQKMEMDDGLERSTQRAPLICRRGIWRQGGHAGHRGPPGRLSHAMNEGLWLA